jgi:hypothetical protein
MRGLQISILQIPVRGVHNQTVAKCPPEKKKIIINKQDMCSDSWTYGMRNTPLFPISKACLGTPVCPLPLGPPGSSVPAHKLQTHAALRAPYTVRQSFDTPSEYESNADKFFCGSGSLAYFCSSSMNGCILCPPSSVCAHMPSFAPSGLQEITHNLNSASMVMYFPGSP